MERNQREARRRLSKTISHALRHEPHLYELELDEQGWVSTEALLAGLRAHRRDWRALEAEEIAAIVAEDAKGRYELDEARGRIRALYGHSTESRLDKVAAEPPAVLYHGTSAEVAEIICEEGLKPMSRQYVHLSAEVGTALEVGRRKGEAITLLRVDAARAHEEGVRFYRGNALVWLADAIPASLITKQHIPGK